MSAEIITMIGNLSQSLVPVQALLSGIGYLVGVFMMITAIGKLKKVGGGGGSQEKMFVPIAYFLGGSALIFLPTALSVLSNTAFGTSSILAYTQFRPYNIYSAMKVVIQTAGLLWFLRGCILLVHSSEAGAQEGPKGLTFLFAGILAMNFEGTIGILNYTLNHLMSISLNTKNNPT